MPKILCACGELLRYSDIPNPIEWLLISDEDFDKFEGLIDAEEVYKSMTSMLQCPACGRLWVFWGGFENPPQQYYPADK